VHVPSKGYKEKAFFTSPLEEIHVRSQGLDKNSTAQSWHKTAQNQTPIDGSEQPPVVRVRLPQLPERELEGLDHGATIVQ
jgi:hypothetical protein